MCKAIISLSILILILCANCNSQGCLAIRNLTGFGQFAALGYKETRNDWMLDINNRFFHATQAFKGNKNVTPADPRNGLSIYEYTTNLELSKEMKNGWGLTIDLPFSANSISDKLEHVSGVYHTTSDFGMGDLRVTAYKWLLNINKVHKGNIQAGLGLKFPTGNYHSVDYFYYSKEDPTLKMLAPVNPAIQLGDGGTGIISEINAFYIFNHSFSAFTNLFYLMNPVDVNGISNQLAGTAPNPVSVKTTADVNSVPDNYTLRAGVNYTYKLFVLTAGARYEGAPAHDLVGRNDGLRRAGHILSLEPGIQYKFKTSFLYCFFTIPMSRETFQTVPDKRATQITGTYTITGGDFASLIYYVGYTFTF